MKKMLNEWKEYLNENEGEDNRVRKMTPAGDIEYFKMIMDNVILFILLTYVNLRFLHTRHDFFLMRIVWFPSDEIVLHCFLSSGLIRRPNLSALLCITPSIKYKNKLINLF